MDQLRSSVVNVVGRRTRYLGVSLAIGLGALVMAFTVVNAWRPHPAPLSQTYPSLEAVAEAAIAAAVAGDPVGLRALSLTEDEFRVHIWPTLPASRPERNVPFAFVWGTLHQNSEGHLQQSIHALRGQRLSLVRAEIAGETTDYGTVRVQRDTRLVVRDDSGTERSIRLFGSVVEQGGRYKIFSFVVD